MLEGIKMRMYPLQIKQRLILGALAGLVLFAFGLAVAFLTVDHSIILEDAMKMQDQLTYKVIHNGQ